MTSRPIPPNPDPKRDLVLERMVDVPRERVWTAWTDPAHLKTWFTPAPWQTVDCEIDLRPGGAFCTVMRSPEGQDFPNVGCYLDVVSNERLVWTTALGPGFRPAPPHAEVPAFTAFILLEPRGRGTRYVACVIHQNEGDARKHEAMGFHEGWGKALDQLVAMARTM